METSLDTSSSQLFRRVVDASTDSSLNDLVKERLEVVEDEDDGVNFLVCQLSEQRIDDASATSDQQLLSDDQGIGGSCSSREDLSSADEGEKEESSSFTLLEELPKRIMALDLRKNVSRFQDDDDDGDCNNVDCKSDVSDDDNTCVALDLTARKQPPPPPLTPIPTPAKANPVESITDGEKAQLRKAYERLVRFLRLDAPGRLTDGQRDETVRGLKYFLVMYMDKVKKSNPAELTMFMQYFSSEADIQKFLNVVISDSKKLSRTPSVPTCGLQGPPKPPSSVLRPAKFATDPDVILARGPGHDRLRTSAAQSHAAPYPQPVRRSDSGGSHHPYHPHHGWRAGQQPHPAQYLGQHYQHPPHNSYGRPAYAQNPGQYGPSHQPMHPSYSLHPPLQAAQSVPSAPVSAFPDDREINLEELLNCAIKLFPLQGDVEGILQLFAPDLPPPERPSTIPALECLNALSPSSPSGSSSTSCRTPQPASVFSNNGGSSPFSGSPASPWMTNTMLSMPTSPCSPPQPDAPQQFYHNSVVMSPPLSSTGSSPRLPASPLSTSMVKEMTRMTLVPNKPQLARSQPPPLIPLNIPAVPSPPVHPAAPKVLVTTPGLKFPSAREEMLASLNPVLKEQSLRRVAKSPMEAFITPDGDGDTPLMVACANPNIKHEDLYAMVEKLKGHPQPPAVFNAVNRKRETALYLAAHEHRPLVAGFLAETMSSLQIPLNQTYQKGNTLIHEVSMWGDAEVLQYLIRVRTADNSKPAFDLNAANREGRSALHEAVQQYQPNDSIYGEGFIKIIQLLLDYGADAGLSDKTSGKTPVHIAIEKRDPALLEMLLSKCPHSANAPMYNDNRPLHSAATLSGVTDSQQLELVNILLKYGADKTLRNKANKLPIELVQQDRDRVKSVLQARSRQNNYGC